jgi:hypothetical protein
MCWRSPSIHRATISVPPLASKRAATSEQTIAGILKDARLRNYEFHSGDGHDWNQWDSEFPDLFKAEGALGQSH